MGIYLKIADGLFSLHRISNGFTFSSEQFDTSMLTQGIVTVGFTSVVAPLLTNHLSSESTRTNA